MSSDLAPDGNPIKTRIVAESFDNFTLNFCVQEFGNCTMIFVTETGNPGTWYQIRKEKLFEDAYDITTLFGAENPDLELTARVIAEVVYKYSDQPIILSLNLTHHSKATLTAISKQISNIMGSIKLSPPPPSS